MQASQNSNPFENAKTQLIWAMQYVPKKYQNQENIEILSTPQSLHSAEIEIQMDNGEIQSFQAYRSQHNNARGPYKWGIRFHPQVSSDEVQALSLWMSLKCAVIDIPLGGGKWWIIVDPKELSERELERLSRGYVQSLSEYLGPQTDVPAPDVNTNPKIMALMMDEYSKIAWVSCPGSFTGKPIAVGWSLGRATATAQWWLYVLQTLLELTGQTLADKTVIVQWAGNAGLTFARLATQAWAKVVGISDSRGGVYNDDGLNIDMLENLKQDGKSVQELSNTKKVSSQEILTQMCDILVPAALENQITQENAPDIQASIIVELANGPTTPEADTILHEKNIDVIPDILANAGWVMVSYFEQVQNANNYYWDIDEVDTKLNKKITQATKDVFGLSQQHNTTYRNAAYAIWLTRILEAMDLRGWI